jgi:DNA-binding transcriptional MerR regulator
MSRSRATGKSDAAFRTISEVSDHLQVPQHVLRFWETKFEQVQPTKRGGGRRYYRPEDIELLRQIRDCLYAEGYTIKGVQKLLREGQLSAARKTAAGNGKTKGGDDSDGAAAEAVASGGAAARGPERDAARDAVDSGGEAALASGGAGQLGDRQRQLLRDVLRELEQARADLRENTPPRRSAA